MSKIVEAIDGVLRCERRAVAQRATLRGPPGARMLAPPIAPMLAQLAREVPEGAYLYEPKWDGFRALVFRDGPELYLQSRDERPLLRYFPELEAPLLAQLPARCVLDGELVLARGDRLAFDLLQLRLHPAASRIAKLSVETPAQFVAFDLLQLGDEVLLDQPMAARRERLEALLAHAAPPLRLTPATRDPAVARDWFARFEGAGLDGVVAKSLADTYQAGKRALVKVKHERTADCVVAGFRWHEKAPDEVGSLLLGLYDDDGRLGPIGVAAGFAAKTRRELTARLGPYREDARATHPWAGWTGGDALGSRWSAGKDLSFEPVRLALVAEVSYNQLSGGRLRHPAKFLRFREDRAVASCRYDQLEALAPAELAALFETRCL